MQPSNSDRINQPWWRTRLASFGFALRGIKVLLGTQPHARFHLFATIAVFFLGVFLSISVTSWCLVILSVGLVWTAEAINSAIEFLVDLVHPEWHVDAGRIKDLAAGGVLLAAWAAVLVGVLVFGSRLIELGHLPFLG